MVFIMLLSKLICKAHCGKLADCAGNDLLPFVMFKSFAGKSSIQIRKAKETRSIGVSFYFMV